MVFIAVGGAGAGVFPINDGFLKPPSVTVSAGENAIIKQFRPTQVTQSTGLGLTSATLVRDGSRFHEDVKSVVGKELTINVGSKNGKGGTNIFVGRVASVNRTFSPKSEMLSLTCAGFNNFDLGERDFIYGQKSFQIDKVSGTEDIGQISFFNRVPCVFNKDGLPNRVEPRVFGEWIFESAPVQSLDANGNALTNRIRNPAGDFWTPMQMLEYILAFATSHPESTSILEPNQIKIHDPQKLLQTPAGKNERFLLNVNVDRLSIGAAISKVMGMVGVNWFADVSETKIKITPISTKEPGETSGTRKDVYVPSVVLGTLPNTQPLTWPGILTDTMNLSNGEIRDSTTGSSSGVTEIIAHTEPEFVWAEWKLKPGWDKKLETLILAKGPQNLASIQKLLNDSKKATDQFGNKITVNPAEVRKRLEKYLREWIVDEDGGRTGFDQGSGDQNRDPFVFKQLSSLTLPNAGKFKINGNYHTTRTHTIRPRPFKNKKDFVNTRDAFAPGRPKSRLFSNMKRTSGGQEVTDTVSVDSAQARALSTHAGILLSGASLMGKVVLPHGMTLTEIAAQTKKLQEGDESVFNEIFFESGVHGDHGRTVVIRSQRFNSKTFKRALLDGKAYKWRNQILTKPLKPGQTKPDHDQRPIDESGKLESRLVKTLGEVKDTRKACSFTIPNIEVGYKMGDWIGEIKGRNLKINSPIVGISWNFESMTTTLNLEDPMFRLFSQMATAFPDGQTPR